MKMNKLSKDVQDFFSKHDIGMVISPTFDGDGIDKIRKILEKGRIVTKVDQTSMVGFQIYNGIIRTYSIIPIGLRDNKITAVLTSAMYAADEDFGCFACAVSAAAIVKDDPGYLVFNDMNDIQIIIPDGSGGFFNHTDDWEQKLKRKLSKNPDRIYRYDGNKIFFTDVHASTDK